MFEQPCSLLDPDEIPEGVLPAPLLPDLATAKGSKPDLLSDNPQSEPEVTAPAAQYGSSVDSATSLLTAPVEQWVDEAAALASVFSSIPDVAITNKTSVAEVSPSTCVEQSLLQDDVDERMTADAAEPSSSELPHVENAVEVQVEEQGFPSPENSSSSDSPPAALASEPNESAEPVLLGDIPPFWIPDADADACMNCELKFTTFRRRHHCRACGKVMCAKCCNGKAALAYMECKTARVCSSCLEILQKDGRNAVPRSQGGLPSEESTESGSSSLVSPTSPQVSPARPPPNGSWPPNPNNPAEYCSTVPPWEQAQRDAPPPTVLVPVGVLKRDGSNSSSRRSAEPKQVMFSDGIRPGGDLTELTEEPDGAVGGRPNPRSVAHHRSQRKAALAAAAGASGASRSSRVRGATGGPPGRSPINPRPRMPGMFSAALSFLRGALPLPPVVSYDEYGDLKLEHCSDTNRLLERLQDSAQEPVTFALTKNLHVHVKIVNLQCCVFRECWCFLTSGMQTAAQDEVLVLLERLPDEEEIPRDVFYHFLDLYERSSKGQFIMPLGHSLITPGNPPSKFTFLGSTDYGGFLFIRPTLQCLKNLLLPPPGTPFLVGILLQKWELPWAKILPLRLMLRLGAEFRYYPCPLFSVRNRKPLYCEIGHTIIKLLADFRQYAYTVPCIPGMVIHMEEKQTLVRIPRNRYDAVMKALGNSNDHVLAFGGNFSPAADSHLVCIQNEDGNYQTQAINIQNRPRKTTGATFLVFNGALKTSSGLSAKSSIVEDGLMVHIPSETMTLLRSALREMNDFEVGCGPLSDAQPDELVVVQWVADDKGVNVGVRSPIDALSFEGVKSVRIPSSTDFLGESRLIRWTELFLLRVDDNEGPWSEPLNISRMAEGIGRSTCIALIPHLDELKRAGYRKIGLRATIDVENVSYEAGSKGARLPSSVMNDLDSELIPVIHRAASSSQDAPSITLELIFHIMDQ